MAGPPTEGNARRNYGNFGTFSATSPYKMAQYSKVTGPLSHQPWETKFSKQSTKGIQERTNVFFELENWCSGLASPLTSGRWSRPATHVTSTSQLSQNYPSYNQTSLRSTLDNIGWSRPERLAFSDHRRDVIFRLCEGLYATSPDVTFQYYRTIYKYIT